jgi:hypothetical protein
MYDKSYEMKCFFQLLSGELLTVRVVMAPWEGDRREKRLRIFSKSLPARALIPSSAPLTFVVIQFRDLDIWTRLSSIPDGDNHALIASAVSVLGAKVSAIF